MASRIITSLLKLLRREGRRIDPPDDPDPHPARSDAERILERRRIRHGRRQEPPPD